MAEAARAAAVNVLLFFKPLDDDDDDDEMWKTVENKAGTSLTNVMRV